MLYSEIKQRVYDLFALPYEEIKRAGYADKIYRSINEGLFRIAHSILPNIRAYTVKLSKEVLPAQVEMPPDFISFTNEQNAYLNGHNFVLTNFVGRSGVILTGKETEEIIHKNDIVTYVIYYNAMYPKLIENGDKFQIVKFYNEELIPINNDNYYITTISTNEYDLPDIAGNIVPHYVVGQLLTLDDKVRSIAELNEFDIMLSQVDVSQNERQRDYHSVRGWY